MPEQLSLSFPDPEPPIWWACGITGSRLRMDWWPCGCDDGSAAALFCEGWQVFLGTMAELDALTTEREEDERERH